MAQALESGITSGVGLPRGFTRGRARRASRSGDLRGRAVGVGLGGKVRDLLDVAGWIVRVGEHECHRLGREVTTLHQPLVILLEQQRAGEPDHGLVVGEDPDDSERRPISLLTRSSGLVLRSLVQCSGGNA